MKIVHGGNRFTMNIIGYLEEYARDNELAWFGTDDVSGIFEEIHFIDGFCLESWSDGLSDSLCFIISFKGNDVETYEKRFTHYMFRNLLDAVKCLEECQKRLKGN